MSEVTCKINFPLSPLFQKRHQIRHSVIYGDLRLLHNQVQVREISL